MVSATNHPGDYFQSGGRKQF
jgi:hypothetical protein